MNTLTSVYIFIPANYLPTKSEFLTQFRLPSKITSTLNTSTQIMKHFIIQIYKYTNSRNEKRRRRKKRTREIVKVPDCIVTKHRGAMDNANLEGFTLAAGMGGRPFP